MSIKNRILIVDDDPIMQTMLRECVLSLGYQPIICDDIYRAKYLFSETKPHLVITDLYMPDKGKIKKMGYKLASWVKSQDEHCPVITLSSETDIAKQVECFLHGCSLFLTKPVDIQTLSAKIIRLSNLCKLCRKQFSKHEKYGAVNYADAKS